MKIFIIYFIIISIISCIVTVSDKYRAKHSKWRIPEKTLFLLAIAGGSAAMYITMLAIRHKTKHMRFMLGLPLIFALQAAALMLVTQKIN